jgi:hypothetical protein
MIITDVRVRLRELNHEIEGLQAAIAMSLADEALLLRTRGAGCELDILQLAEERHRNESALDNLEKEARELNAAAAFTKTA